MGTPYEQQSRFISRFPLTTATIGAEYSQAGISAAVEGSYQGPLYIDYYNTSIDPVAGDQSKIKKTGPLMTWNARVACQWGPVLIHGAIENIFNTIQDEKHLDDAAFLYAPVYGTMLFGGISLTIDH